MRRRLVATASLLASLAILGSLGSLGSLVAPLAGQPPPSFRLRPLAAATRHLEEGFLNRPSGVAYDPASGELWVADTGNHLLGAFTAEGTPIFTTRAGGAVREPRRVTVAPDGGLWVLDIDRSRIVRLDWRGRPLPSPSLAGLPAEPVFGALAFDGDGNLWVGENGEGRIHVFDRELAPRFRFGSRGGGEEQFLGIVDIAIAGDRVVVVDAVGVAVQVYNLRGELQRAWGEHALGVENFSLPQAAAIVGERIVVVDALRHEIKFFDPDGRFLGRFGGYGSGPGQVRGPADVAADGAGRLYVADKGNGRVQVFAIVEAGGE